MGEKKRLVVMITCGLDDERSSVAWSVISGAITTGLDVAVFLTSSGVDWARKGGADHARLNPLDPPIKDMIQKFLDTGGPLMVCPPCWNVRGYKEDELIDAAVLKGSPGMHELIVQGAATLCF